MLCCLFQCDTDELRGIGWIYKRINKIETLMRCPLETGRKRREREREREEGCDDGVVAERERG